MGQRGRKPASELTITRAVAAVARPDAPYDLTDEQSKEWWAIVNRMPADWFPREMHGLLTQYCRHVVAARRIARLIDKIDGAKSSEEYDNLYKMQDREGRAMSSLATKMRLTQQSTYDPKMAKKGVEPTPPWMPK